MAKKPVSEKIKQEFYKTRYARDSEHAVLGGVIAGLANYTSWDLTLLRVLFVLVVFFTGFFPFAIAYLVVWICAPDRSELPAPANPPVAKSEAAATNTSTDRPTPPLALRVVLMILGIIGFLATIPALITLIPITIITIIAVSSATIVEPALFITTAVLGGVLAFSLIGIGIHLSTALVAAKLGKRGVISLIISCIFCIMLSIAATTTGALWLHRAGKSGIETTFNGVIDNLDITIDQSDHEFTLDVGPIHIHTN